MCLYRIFDAKDDDCVNRKKVSANERAINHYLKDYSEEQKQELLKILDIEYVDWNYNCVRVLELEKLGWKIKEE